MTGPWAVPLPLKTNQLPKLPKKTFTGLSWPPSEGIVWVLSDLFNLSYQHANLPAIWKHATILPILKAGKPEDQGTSYRPISILCPASKVLEKLMLNRIGPHLHLADTQHGYRPGRSTVSALMPLAQRVVTGFNQRCLPEEL